MGTAKAHLVALSQRSKIMVKNMDIGKAVIVCGEPTVIGAKWEGLVTNDPNVAGQLAREWVRIERELRDIESAK